MLTAIKANDIDAVMSCIAFSDPADAAAVRVVVERDVAIHRLVEAALAKWGERAFAGAGLDASLLAVSDSVIDRWIQSIDTARATGVDEGSAELNGFGEPTVPRADWHGPLVEMTAYQRYVRVEGEWKVDATRLEGEPLDGQAAALMEELARWNHRVEQLARETEAGRIKTAAELSAALASPD
jgi:hypothetical protein